VEHVLNLTKVNVAPSIFGTSFERQPQLDEW